MKITEIQTLISPVQPNLCLVCLHTNEGIVGLGETFLGAAAVEAYVHTQAAPILFGLDALSPEAVTAALAGYVGYQGSGVETRANSAIDIALWDLLGKRAGVPVRELLGGPVVDAIPVYNTCAGPSYVNRAAAPRSANWGLPADSSDGFEDLWAFLHRPAELARELLDSGVRGMKVWPFDLAAEASRGGRDADLRDGLRILDAIRGEVGEHMQLYVELHGLWTLGGAERVLRALEPYSPAWVEDPIRPDSGEALKRLAADTSVPIASGETLCGRRGYKPLLDAEALDVAIVDLGWTGGLTEGRKIASLADQYGIPVALHDCTGPVNLAAAVHLSTAVPNSVVQEFTRAFYYDWYSYFVDCLPDVADGQIRPGNTPGLGLCLRTDVLQDERNHVRRSTR